MSKPRGRAGLTTACTACRGVREAGTCELRTSGLCELRAAEECAIILHNGRGAGNQGPPGVRKGPRLYGVLVRSRKEGSKRTTRSFLGRGRAVAAAAAPAVPSALFG